MKYLEQPIITLCPVCFFEQGKVLYSIDVEQATQHFVLREVKPEQYEKLRGEIIRLWQKSTSDVVRCERCGFCYSSPFIAGDEQFYSLAYERTSYPKWKWEYERTRFALKRLSERGLIKDFTLLEIGAGNGSFIRRIAPDITVKENILCTEFSDYGIKEIKKYGIKCVSTGLSNLLYSEYAAWFDVVCIFQVLEHMDKLDEIFNQLFLLSKSSCHVFISVPNPERIEFNELNSGLLDMPPNHVGRWNRGSIEVLAQRHGWRLAEYEIQPDNMIYKSTSYIIDHYRNKRQQNYSLANRIEHIRQRSTRRFLQGVVAGLYAIGSFTQIIKLLRGSKLGDSLWFHLEKQPEIRGIISSEFCSNDTF